MEPNEEFIQRLKEVLDRYTITPAKLADRLGVQRSGISHVMSGRNKPSFDFLQKLTAEFDDLDLNWLISGSPTPGHAIIKEESPIEKPPGLFTSVITGVTNESSQAKEEERPIYKKANPSKGDKRIPTTKPPQQEKVTIAKNDKVERVILFYADNTFEAYESR